MARVVILGAGLTGLSTAYHLEKNNFFDFKIFEKEKKYGGLVSSVKHEGFTFDFTGHLIHCSNDYFQSFLSTILPKNSCNKILRSSFVFTHDRFIPYPIQMNIHHLPTQAMAETLCGFAKRKHFLKNPKNFYEWVGKHFGTGLAKHFFFPYNKKLLQHDVKKIHHSWTGRFVPKTTIHDILKSMTGQKKDDIGYNHHFLYPKKNGIQYFTDRLRKHVASPIDLNHQAVKIDAKQKRVIFANGHIEPYEILITTIPLTDLLSITKEPTNYNLTNKREKLLCTSVINFNLGFTPGNFTDKHWVYIPETKYEFYRAGFWTNFSQNLAPKNKSSLYGELAYRTHNKKNLQKKTEQSIEQTCRIFGISKSQIVTEKILHLPHSYVVYDEWREYNLPLIHQRLQTAGVHSIGRYGAWKYSSMQEAILDGKAAARTILYTKDHKFKKQFIPARQALEFERTKIIAFTKKKSSRLRDTRRE